MDFNKKRSSLGHACMGVPLCHTCLDNPTFILSIIHSFNKNALRKKKKKKTTQYLKEVPC